MGGYPICRHFKLGLSFYFLVSEYQMKQLAVVFDILHGEKICAVLGKNMANINSNRFQQVLKNSLQRKFHQR